MPKLKGRKELDMFEKEKDEQGSKMLRDGKDEWGHECKQAPGQEGPGVQTLQAWNMSVIRSDSQSKQHWPTAVGQTSHGRSVHESRQTTYELLLQSSRRGDDGLDPMAEVELEQGIVCPTLRNYWYRRPPEEILKVSYQVPVISIL